ncbi:hypothetical protein CP02DC18_1156A, partial [Chlamydia psittaci 02DC18]
MTSSNHSRPDKIGFQRPKPVL